MSKISTITIPDFIEEYSLHNFDIKVSTKKFTEEIKQVELENGQDKDGFYYKLQNPSENIKQFSSFYLKKSKLDSRLQCEYEDELIMGKSIIHELFFCNIDDKYYNLYIESINDQELVLRMI